MNGRGVSESSIATDTHLSHGVNKLAEATDIRIETEAVHDIGAWNHLIPEGVEVATGRRRALNFGTFIGSHCVLGVFGNNDFLSFLKMVFSITIKTIRFLVAIKSKTEKCLLKISKEEVIIVIVILGILKRHFSVFDFIAIQIFWEISR
jgi:hypothetical protein